MTLWDPRQINFQKLAGVRSIVGLDITDQRVRAVELEIRGGTFNKSWSRFDVRKFFTCNLAGDVSSSSSADAVRDEFKRQGITSRYAVSTIQTGNTRTIRAEVPSDVTSVDEWLHDNFGKLIKIPVPLQELLYRYEVLQTGESSHIAEFVFARRAEVESIMQFVRSIELELLVLSTDAVDCVNPLFFARDIDRAEPLSFLFRGDEGTILYNIEGGSVVSSFPVSSAEPPPDDGGRRVVLAGGAGRGGSEVFNPFGLPTEYTLAAGLAIRGFLPEIHAVNLVSQQELAIIMERVSKGLFYRLVLSCGGFLLALLLIQSILSIYMDSRRNLVEDSLLASSISRSELSVLEKQIMAVKNELAMLESDTARSDLAMVLHDIARIVPEGVWLYRITMTGTGKSGNLISISGYSGDGRTIAEFVRLLERESSLRNVRIVRSGLPSYGENVTVISRKISTPFTFTVSLAAGR